MLRERNKLLQQVHRVLDLCLTGTAFVAAYFIKRRLLPEPFGGLSTEPNYYVVLLLIIIIWYIVFQVFHLYESYRRQLFLPIFWNMVKAVTIGMLALSLVLYVLKITDVSRILMGVFYFLDIALLGLSKALVYFTLARFRGKGFNYRGVLIVGSRERAREVIDTIGDQIGAGFRVIGCLDLEPDDVGRPVKNGIKIIGTVAHIEIILREEVVDELIFAMPLKKIDKAGYYINKAEEMGVSVRIVPDWQIHSLMYRPGIAAIRIEDFLGLPTMALHTTPPNQGALLIKNVFDLVSAGLGMLIILPFFGVTSLAIKLSSKGPVFFKQERSGLNGRRFMVYKFRTMVADAEAKRRELEALNETDGPVFKIRKDPRIIPYVGTILRRTGLDELPQLINVLKGEMSLIGPRPPIPAEVEEYDVWQRRRLSMKPGLTCLWQVSPDRNDLSFHDWMKLDLQYIDNWSLALDLKIMLLTARAVLSAQGR